jgi:hypothetical protein
MTKKEGSKALEAKDIAFVETNCNDKVPFFCEV